MSLSKKRAYIEKNCVACGNCVKSCPMNALSIFRGLYAVVNENKCVGCGKCALACPAGIIEVKLREADIA